MVRTLERVCLGAASRNLNTTHFERGQWALQKQGAKTRDSCPISRSLGFHVGFLPVSHAELWSSVSFILSLQILSVRWQSLGTS